MKPHSTLELITAQFTAWREIRTNRREPIPDYLRQQVLALKSQHKSSDIRKALGISGSMLKQWAETEIEQDSPTFISLPSPEPTISATETAAQIVCQLPNGITITLSQDTLNERLMALLFSLNIEAKS